MNKNKSLLIIAGSVLMTGGLLQTKSLAQTYRGCFTYAHYCSWNLTNFGGCVYTPQPNNCACVSDLDGSWIPTYDCQAGPPPPPHLDEE